MGYSTRKRLQEIAKAEAEGENLWTDQFDDGALIKLDELWRLLTDDSSHSESRVSEHVVRAMRLTDGWSVPGALYAGAFRSSKDRGTDFLLDLIEHLVDAIEAVTIRGELFVSGIGVILNEHRIAFRLVDKRIVPVSSDELHAEAVEPALRLLVGQRFSGAHAAYLKALREIQHSDPADAITDAGTALQETLSALGCQGKVLGELLRDAKTKGLLAGHDQALIDGIKKFGDWAAGERNRGEAHRHSDATLADAWLMVHVVGALVVRLVDPEKPRGSDDQ